MREILIRPVVTEKMSSVGEDLGAYGFIVDKTANKIQIRNAVEDMYGVNVKKVRTMVCAGTKGYMRTAFGISMGKKGAYKKAVVTLEKGEEIDFYADI